MKKRKIKYSAVFFVCWFLLLVLLVELLVILPTMAVYIFTKEKK